MNSPDLKIEVTKEDDPVHYYCPICSHAFVTSVKLLLRGLDLHCEKCAAHITTSPHSTTPEVVKRTLTGDDESLESMLVFRRDGLWLFLDEDERAQIGTLDFDSDRAVALVLGSMIETRLQRTILARLSNRDKDIEDRLFHPSGPLGAFSTKIHVAHLIGLISKEAHADLVLLKDIRNLFAHKSAARDFQMQQIKDKCANFKLIDAKIEDVREGLEVEVVNLPNPTPIIRMKHATKRKRSAKHRYLMTAQIFNMQLVLGELKRFPLPLI